MSTLLCCIAAIGLHLGSAHVAPAPDGEQLNNANPGAYVELANGLVLGSYYNSLRRQSTYLGYHLQGPSWGPVQAALTVGAITGYAAHPLPAAVPTLYLDMGGAGLRLSYIPKLSHTKVHTLHLSVEYRF